ncbi:hypothetical protein J2X12_003704 [Pseudarthrobacter oxydans]|uniref:Uncharacterized protein n=1 Tax=Pseudarthrobacter oxydans TaxID=1671 RepID=A0AAW8NFY6_PSEOX|nr:MULTISPECIES: hypothetical protein [Micrococcaceae]MDR7165650.1 hypothetical protein [Pseudarthrobacter oxydans]TNB75676.1 hypothetical protein FHJ30_03265 [Arthrobacter sp. BB-1]
MSEYSSALVGFAVLRANYNAEAPSYIDNFRGFVLGVLAENEPKPLTRETVASQINDSFGIRIPDLVVGKILKRAKHTKHIDGDATGYVLTELGLRTAPAVRGLRDKYLRQQRDLEDRFLKFVDSEFPEHRDILATSVAEELSKYLERHAVPLIASSVKGKGFTRPHADHQSPGFDYVIARFVAHLHERDDIGFSYIEESAKGAILAAVVTLDTSSFRNSLGSLSIYLDTPVLIDLLGYSGSASMRATSQLIELAQAQGASLRVFEHSLREVDGVLQSAENYSRNAGRREARPIDLHFQEQGWNAADIVIARQSVPDAIKALGVETSTKPDNYRQYGLDEEKLEKSLQDVVHYKSENTRRYDVESISAIHRLRKGSSRGTLDRCGAVLLTDNTELVRAVQLLEDERHDWPLAMTDSALAGILWARSPAVATELPRHMVLAAAYAGMQPDPHLWSRYVDEVGVLEGRGGVSADDAIVLRSTTVGRNALMEETLGIDAEMTSESPLAVLERIRSEIKEPVLEQLRARQNSEASATTSADNAAAAWIKTSEEVERLAGELQKQKETNENLQVELKNSRQHESERRSALKTHAARRAKFLTNLLLWCVAGPLIVLVALKLIDPPWLGDVPEWLNWAIVIAAVVTAVLAILDSLGQGTVTQWLSPVERKLASRIESKELKKVSHHPTPGEGEMVSSKR